MFNTLMLAMWMVLIKVQKRAIKYPNAFERLETCSLAKNSVLPSTVVKESGIKSSDNNIKCNVVAWLTTNHCTSLLAYMTVP